jgi:hypothetical protein
MAELRFDISMSVDGFIAGPNPSEEHPLCEGGTQLHERVVKLAAWLKPHGLEGGEINASTEVVEESIDNIGVTAMERNMFGGGPAPRSCSATAPGSSTTSGAPTSSWSRSGSSRRPTSPTSSTAS